MKDQIFFSHKAFLGNDEKLEVHQAACRKFAPGMAEELGESVQDVADWLYEGEPLSGNESETDLVKQWKDEH